MNLSNVFDETSKQKMHKNHEHANNHRRLANCWPCCSIIIIVIARIFLTATDARVDFHERIEAGQMFLFVADAVVGTEGD